MAERRDGVLGAGMTRGRFLAAAALAGAAGGVLGCGPSERVRPLYTPRPMGGEWSFRSRPDLRPPAVEVNRRAARATAGYSFVAPKNGPGETGPGQRGPMIVDDEGHPVWFRPMPGEDVDAMDFKAQTYGGRPVLTWWQGTHGAYGRGEYPVLDGSYAEVARVRAGNGYSGDLHECLVTDRDTALIIIYEPMPADLSPVGGAADGRVAEGIIQELDVASGEVLFEWHSLEHVGVEESYYPLPEDPEAAFDYFHVNSIEVDDDGNLLVSARKTSAAYKLDRETGEVVWRLGGKESDFAMGEGTRTGYQHDARRRADGMLTIFDNRVEGEGEHSRAIVLGLDEDAMRASLVREYVHPEEWFCVTQGSMQNLPNGNAFVGWGSEPGFSEFGADGGVLFDATFPSGVESYRAFRFPWVGRPEDEPAVAAEPGLGSVSVYASWNGATEVDAWSALAGPAPDRLKALGSVPRSGFETAMTVRTDQPYVGVEALDRLGRKLGRSAAIRPG